MRPTLPLGERAPRALTDKQVHEIRLSMERGPVLAARHGVSENTITNARRGRRGYTTPTAEERRAEAERRRRAVDLTPMPLEELIIGDVYARDGLRDQDRQETMDAAGECPHGRLASDSTPACGCWPQEITKTNPKEDNDGSHHTRLARFAEQATLAHKNDRDVADQRQAA